MLTIYNTLTKQKEVFRPINPGHVRLYVCGITMYDYCHIGHARMLIIFDVITRYLRNQGYTVTYVRNITDIDDKIIRKAQELGLPFTQVVEQFTRAFHENCAALDLLPPDVEPRATEHIDFIIRMIQTLLEKGYAYLGANGDVYYAVNRFPNYGQLAKQNLSQLQAGARIDINEAKCDPLDFVLWKLSKPGEPAWDSPWGAGRPGWHIECSVMSTRYLGNHFDIHGGGQDLIFPHHENEIAQSEAATGCKFVNTWVHVGFLQVNDEKMSKSLGNFLTIQEIVDQYPGEIIRFFMISAHYRSPLNFSTQALENAKGGLTRLYMALRGLALPTSISPDQLQTWQQLFQTAMNDDFNTPEALAVLFELAREINRWRQRDLQKANELGFILKQLGGVIGLLQQDPEHFLHSTITHDELTQINALIQEREQARQRKDWATADKLRQQLMEMGITVEDTSDGTLWRREK